MAFALTMTAKQIARGITSFKAMSKKQDDFLHMLLMQSLAHGALPINDDDGKRIGGGHGDLTLFAALLEAAGERAKGRKQAIINWATNFASINVDGDGKVKHIPATNKRAKEWDLEAANDTPYWMFEPDAVKTPLTLAAMIKIIEAQMVNKLAKAKEDNNLGDNVVMLEAYVNRMVAASQAAAEAAKRVGNNVPAGENVAVAAG